MRAKLTPRNPNRDPQAAADLAAALACGRPLAELLVARGMTTARDAAAFLSPGVDQLHDPMGLQGMAQAVQRIQTALEMRERICVYGDYDVDGGAATAVLVSYLHTVGADVFFYIPHRHDEGYGLNMAAVKTIAERGTKLLITVDCGITSPREAAYAKELGMDVVVTDHHQPLENPPDCIMINPKMPGQRYPYLELCGAGIAGKLVQALGGLDALLARLDLVALATVADVMPLTGENRAMVAIGIQRIRQGKCAPGILALCEVAGIKPQEMQAQHIAFGLAPRINAGGRMGDPDRGARLLLAQSREEATALAAELDGENKARRAVEVQIYAQAVEQVRAMKDFPDSRVLILTGDGWNEGVVGIVASRLVERYGRPVLLLSRNEEGRLTGSGRSIPALSLIDALRECGDLFIRYGGHRQAAGLTMEQAHLPQLRRRLHEAVARRISAQDLLPVCEYDLELALTDVSLSLVESLSRLQPFGQANPAPMVRLSGMPVDVRRMGGDGSHLRLMLADGKACIPVVAFRMGEEHLRLSSAGSLEAVVELGENCWQGRSSLQARAEYIAPVVGENLPESWYEREEEKVLRAFWDYIRYNMNKTNTAAHIAPGFIPDEAVMRDTLMDLLSANIEGTLILVHSREALLALGQILSSLGLSDRVAYLYQQAGGEERRFHSVVLYPGLENGWHRGWKDIVCYDGLPSVSLADALSQHTGARVWVAANASGRAFWGRYAAMLQKRLQRDQMGALYKALRASDGQRFSSVGSLAAAMGLEQWLLEVALTVFGQLNFLDASAARQGRLAWHVSPDPSPLTDSAAYHALITAAARISGGDEQP